MTAMKEQSKLPSHLVAIAKTVENPTTSAAPVRSRCSIDLLHCGATSTGTRWGTTHASSRHAALGHAATAARSLVDLHHDRVHSAFELLLLCLELVLLRELVLIEPVKAVLHGLLDLLLVAILELFLELLLIQCVAHREAVVLEAILRLDLHLVGLVLALELFGLLDHAVNLGLRETTFFIGDGDLIRLPCGLVLRRDVEDAVGIDVEGHLDLGHAARRRGDAVEVEFPKHVVILGHGTLSFENLDEHPGLVISVRREGLALLRGDG